ncbi:Uu.00g075310.m01.CDS01 [Anthostomella pinea]|uniref:Uu.00g075310.m01.CDS01 n=1 Tax=Anthostomella pinea TaxID=933095 RepID=A0AAI8VQ01_9PEZI|nr:Uu.00g075310.m01.CDS01 [Anthostomella pinea]
MPARFPLEAAFQPRRVQEQKELETLLSGGVLSRQNVLTRYVITAKKYSPGCEVEVANTELVGKQTTIPIPEILNHWQENGQFFKVQACKKGKPLTDALPTLAHDDIASVGREVGESLLQLRRITSPTTKTLVGCPVFDSRLGYPLEDVGAYGSYSECASDADVADNLALAIQHVDDTTLTALMAKMPSCEPFTFTHSDVHEGNIVVRDGKFVGLAGWGLASYSPCWWEYVNADPLLADHFPEEMKYPKALEWFTVYQAVLERAWDEETQDLVMEYIASWLDLSDLS